ncbi:YiiX/YebB-like N1pC/P60 family cysteine hydrolase [Legionella sp. PATHC038]|uniref:YiiX/YebB-like N1pC/P60 family cysteine hydrolase n=1 Tax=Legionella sheltonii TaxID=2992041 RepID=UPI0022447CD6|nr:YiiX/YebB-like N1pC/P60 family cysteine hydrolase [Legionella sp. PATHC038]MCW8397188.1 YiiX/YebB-like N1pC/P60 family cysteine hydrolase [Legionella sp. PATHC038]
MKESDKKTFINFILLKFYQFLSKEDNVTKRTYLYDFAQFTQEIKPGDVLLVESHTRMGNIIRLISESTWTHAALYIGRLEEITNPSLREIVQKNSPNLTSDQLIIESVLGEGTRISCVDEYKNDHIRILRPSLLLPEDKEKVIAAAIHKIGKYYSLRHLFDLARFIFPWSFFPRKWRSSLFQHNMLQPTEDICSSMIAHVFQSVNYPILPLIKKDKTGYALIHRNPRLYTPSDFDLSPFFDVIKYPILPLQKGQTYHDLPWKKQLISDDIGVVELKDKE